MFNITKKHQKEKIYIKKYNKNTFMCFYFILNIFLSSSAKKYFNGCLSLLWIKKTV